jgi:hypothetical protein
MAAAAAEIFSEPDRQGNKPFGFFATLGSALLDKFSVIVGRQHFLQFPRFGKLQPYQPAVLIG